MSQLACGGLSSHEAESWKILSSVDLEASGMVTWMGKWGSRTGVSEVRGSVIVASTRRIWAIIS